MTMNRAVQKKRAEALVPFVLTYRSIELAVFLIGAGGRGVCFGIAALTAVAAIATAAPAPKTNMIIIIGRRAKEQ